MAQTLRDARTLDRASADRKVPGAVVPQQAVAPRSGPEPWAELRVAAIVPCHNEAGAVEKVVRDLKHHVPGIDVYVYDNCSTDGTADAARRAGAIVREEHLKGKGNVVRRAFADIEADVYLMIDGDDTYDPAAAPEMIRVLIEGHYDHVLGMRQQLVGDAYRPNHEWGNRVLNRVVGLVFGTNVGDMLSGYRVFSRRFVKSFPAVSREFEIETELTVHTLSMRASTVTLPVGFRERAAGTESKLRTYRDGTKILALILSLARHERPMAFYGVIAGFSLLLALLLGVPVLAQYVETGFVPRMPTLASSIGFGIVACLAMTAGLILDGMRKARHEVSRLAYLQHGSVGS
ncbi:glycosyltransferase [Nocardioides caldifontis]|uniref:glycosyltransferase n=1 Tax=Nocardioides caldifontis TaxID=2588938 RepID=UPI0011DFD68D|nr:glycosyltransferase [Nocardioides caldifontis]